MISSCPNCQQTLKLGEAQKAKLQKALAALAPGKKLTIKCPACQKPIALDSSGAAAQSNTGGIKPPGPPDLSWMKEGVLHDEESLEDIPMALILFPNNKQRDIVRDTIETVGYQVVFAESIGDAQEQMRFVNFACVIMYSQFECPSLENSVFHKYMQEMAMSRRRYLFYILIGPEFHTLYNLQALAHSANLVVNDNDLLQLGVALRRAIPVYEKLFGPFMEERTSAGKS